MQTQPSSGILDEFRDDFLDCWRRLPNKAFFLMLLAAWLALFHFLGNSTLGYVRTSSLLYWMYNAYNSQSMDADDAHGNVVPFLVLGLFWWKRRQLLALKLRTWWPSLILVALGLGIHMLGFGVQQARISIVGLFIGLYGLTGLAWGPGWLRESFFPFCLFVFAVPLGSLGQAVTLPLRKLTAVIVTKIAHLGLAPDLVREGVQIYDGSTRINGQPPYAYDIAPACSGIRSLVALLAFNLIYSVVSFRSVWKWAVMLAAAFPLAVLGNVTRLLITVAVTEGFGPNWGKRVETNAGFVTYAVAIGVALALGHWLRDQPAAARSPAARATEAAEAKMT